MINEPNVLNSEFKHVKTIIYCETFSIIISRKNYCIIMIDFLITQFSECLRFPVVHPSVPLFSPAPWPAVTTVEHRPVAEQHQHGSHWQDRIQLRPPAEAGPAPDRNDGK